MGENREKTRKNSVDQKTSAAFLAPQNGCLDRDWLETYPRELIEALAKHGRDAGIKLYVTGGAVRDWVAGKASQDLDITIPRDAFGFAGILAKELHAAFVPLDQDEDVARLVWHGLTVDFSAFREGASSIEEDLGKRDFTINALAVAMDEVQGGLEAPYHIIDPTGGVPDLLQGVVRATNDSVFANDPLRLLRAYRFVAALGFSLEEKTAELISQHASGISRVASERISYELERIIESARPAAVLGSLAESGLLWLIFPELRKGEGMAQPESHHLDVFSHNLATLDWMVRIQQKPDDHFPLYGGQMAEYLAGDRKKIWLRWAALFHDLGKPAVLKVRDERITFYNHDQVGARKFEETARRLKWSREDTVMIARFIELHMWPFHLSNARLKEGITARACLRLVKAAGEELPGLFMLAMADSLAGQGPAKPDAVERHLADLYEEVDKTYQEHIKPVFTGPRLLTGHDLKDIFGLAPGPIFREILEELQGLQVTGEVNSQSEAIEWVHSFLRSKDIGD